MWSWLCKHCGCRRCRLMMNKPHDELILGIETSCDETAAAVVRGGRDVLSNVVATQHELHERYAGVVPEIASRAHLQRIIPVVRDAVRDAGLEYGALDAIAVGNQPGLIGSLLVGVSAAKALAWSLGKSLIGIDHIQAHLYAGALNDEPIAYPALGLVVSGGHTSLFHVDGPLEFRLLGRTIDDAIGEAFDKAATILQLGYPGGPAVDALASTGDDNVYDLPVASLGRGSLDFSFSGLKTALLYAVCGQPAGRGSSATFQRDASVFTEKEKADFAASFQRAAVTAIMRKLHRAFEQTTVKTLLVGGGVSANSRLRAALQEFAGNHAVALRLPPMEFCVDNAAMIAGLAVHKLRAHDLADVSLSASPRSDAAA